MIEGRRLSEDGLLPVLDSTGAETGWLFGKCAWCNTPLPSKRVPKNSANDGETSHGMCRPCFEVKAAGFRGQDRIKINIQDPH